MKSLLIFLSTALSLITAPVFANVYDLDAATEEYLIFAPNQAGVPPDHRAFEQRRGRRARIMEFTMQRNGGNQVRLSGLPPVISANLQSGASIRSRAFLATTEQADTITRQVGSIHGGPSQPVDQVLLNQVLGEIKCREDNDLIGLRRAAAMGSNIPLLEICTRSGIEGLFDPESEERLESGLHRGVRLIIWTRTNGEDTLFIPEWAVVFRDSDPIAFPDLNAPEIVNNVEPDFNQDARVTNLNDDQVSQLDINRECMICLHNIGSGQGGRATACNFHAFHRYCLNKWIEEKHEAAGDCPTCRRS